MATSDRNDDPSSERIDLDDPASVRRWAEELDATPEQIEEAVGAVGGFASDVEMHLKGSRSTTNSERVEDAGD